MTPGLFEQPDPAKRPPRSLDGEVVRMIREEELVRGVSEIVHPKRTGASSEEGTQVGKSEKHLPSAIGLEETH